MDPERLARAVAAAHRRRTDLIPGGTVVEVDGLAVQVTGLPDPSVNFCVVEREPHDAAAALEAVERTLADAAMPFGIDLPVGLYPDLDRAVRDHGARRLLGRPVMTATVGDLPSLAPPWDAQIGRAGSDADLGALASIDARVFEVDEAVSRGLYARPMAEASDLALLLARLEGEPVGAAVGVRVEDTMGVFGVAVLPDARMRGIGGALTCATARSVGMPDDVAWLFPSERAMPLYERLGFAAGDPWEVWVG